MFVAKNLKSVKIFRRISTNNLKMPLAVCKTRSSWKILENIFRNFNDFENEEI